MTIATRTTLLATLALTPLAAAVIIPIPPRSAFLRASQDTVTDPVILTLATLGIAPGDLIRIRVQGEFTFNTANVISRNSVAVFSSSATLLASNLQQRVPGAIEAGVDFISAPTFNGGLPTDIPQDFRLGDHNGPLPGVDVVVPPGATHLFLSVYDSFYQDNKDTDADFAAEVTLLCAANACCGSTDFDGDGDEATDADIEAFFAAIAGNPCAGCGSTDFDGDGDEATDADIEAFFRVIAGGPCIP